MPYTLSTVTRPEAFESERRIVGGRTAVTPNRAVTSSASGVER
jgi:hypothetical protein